MSYHVDTIRGPIVDGAVESNDISPEFKDHFFSIKFYSDDQYTTPVTPLEGTLVIDATDNGVDYGSLYQGTIAVHNASAPKPSMSGRMVRARFTMGGIKGATHYEYKVFSYN